MAYLRIANTFLSYKIYNYFILSKERPFIIKRNNLNKNYVAVVLSILILFFVDISNAQQNLILSTFAGSPLSKADQTGFYDLILIEAFQRSGLGIKIEHLPAERSLTNANNGLSDGDFVRVPGLDQIYPNLIIVPEKITDFEFVVFTRKPQIQINNWAACKIYNVGIVRGWKILEINLAGAHSLTKVKNQKLLFSMLAKNRADVVVYSRYEGYEMIHQMNLKDIRVLEPPLATKSMFLYLNKKHQKLVPEIAKNLYNMKNDGTLKTISEKTLGKYF